eukprot:gene27115-10535_t
MPHYSVHHGECDASFSTPPPVTFGGHPMHIPKLFTGASQKGNIYGDVDKVKELQRTNSAFRAAWVDWCDTFADGTKDPTKLTRSQLGRALRQCEGPPIAPATFLSTVLGVPVRTPIRIAVTAVTSGRKPDTDGHHRRVCRR